MMFFGGELVKNICKFKCIVYHKKPPLYGEDC